MNIKIILSMMLGLGAISLSSIASANWVDGPCPPSGGPAPCIEAIDYNGSTNPNDWDYYHFNGDGSHAGDWHGMPTNNALDLQFTGTSVLNCGLLGAECELTLGGKVKKCQDSNGDWRVGIQVNGYNIEGDGLCGDITLHNFPWYSKDAAITPHCPFGDDCENFNVYDPNATSYFATVGGDDIPPPGNDGIEVQVFGIPVVTDGHVHNVEFTPGCPASFDFDSEFFDCDEEGLGCSVDGLLVSEIDCLNIY